MSLLRRLSCSTVALVAMLGLTACQPGSQEGQAATAFALDQVGDAYRWGGNGPDQWDCSGLVHAAYRAAGVNVPRTSAELKRTGTPVARAALRDGDLIHTPGHVAIFIGNNWQVAAANSRTGVVVQRMPASGATFTRIR